MALNKREVKQEQQNFWYWNERQAAIQTEITEKTIAETEKQLSKYYSNSMSKVIGQFEQTYNKVISSISDGREPTPADLYKLDTYWQLQAQLAQELDNLGNRQAKLLSRKFMDEWEHIYKAIAIKDNLFFGEIDRQAAQQMINSIWCADGQTWSNRIWSNTKRLKEALNENLIYCVATGKAPSELKQLLMNDFGVSFSRADTLVRTEMAHIQTEAAKARYVDAGIEEVEILADEDERRCDICGKLHQKRYPIHANIPIPAHPKCRCCIIPVVE